MRSRAPYKRRRRASCVRPVKCCLLSLSGIQPCVERLVVLSPAPTSRDRLECEHWIGCPTVWNSFGRKETLL
ncbi:hypothetical protein OJAV_G00232850 [Oryzias javanicus]|uniref:Uncharacterized protein n=1 Tax=Oryzias javanicus TaxID=123683 RepID=A0A437C104_ORYJA|nr:hypothetical protein OJAV_G00232850 [Oryzias javanicus]